MLLLLLLFFTYFTVIKNINIKLLPIACILVNFNKKVSLMLFVLMLKSLTDHFLRAGDVQP